MTTSKVRLIIELLNFYLQRNSSFKMFFPAFVMRIEAHKSIVNDLIICNILDSKYIRECKESLELLQLVTSLSIH